MDDQRYDYQQQQEEDRRREEEDRLWFKSFRQAWERWAKNETTKEHSNAKH